MLLLSLAGLVPAEHFHVEPESIKQGELLQVFGGPAAKLARLNGKTIPLFSQPGGQAGSGGSIGLMPVAVRAKPGPYKLEWLDGQGQVLRSQPVTILDAHYLVQNVQLSPVLTQLHSTQNERDDVAKFFDKETPVRYWQFPIQAPIPGCLTSPFGVQRAHNGKLTGDIHSGLDQRGAMGTPIHAVAAGEVRLAGEYALHGGTVAIDHGQGLKSMYLHMSKIAAKPGDKVEAGDVIGYVGSTGRSTGPHLHWALYAQGEAVNPSQWFDLPPCAPKVTKPAPKPRRRT